MKRYFNFFGFKINTRNFILTLVIALTVVLFLVGVDILWFDVSWYGLLIGMAFVLAVVIASELAFHRELYKDFSFDVIWLVFPFAIIGARLFYVLNSLNEFETIGEVLAVWNGGLSIYGGIIGGAIGIIIFARIKKLNIIKIFDVASPVLILGQAIGRWGNFFNQEVYGLEVTNSALQFFPFATYIENKFHTGWFLPLFFYESVLNLIGFFVLVTILRKHNETGIVTCSYLMYYGLVRFCLEFLRVNEYVLYIPGTKIMFSSLISILFILIGLAGFIYLKLKNNKANT